MNAVETIVDSGVDWLTLTAEEEPAASRLIRLGERYFYEWRQDGDEVRSWAQFGYYGEKCGPAAKGRRGNGAIVMVGGGGADLAFALGNVNGIRCSRIDCQTTIRYRPRRDRVARDEYDSGIERGPGPRLGAKLGFVTGSDGGSTCYLGSRKSARFGRLYDKWRQSGDDAYRDAWRWEVEYKADLADSVYRAMLVAPDRQRASHDFVRNHYDLHGFHAPSANHGTVMLGPVGRAASDRERKLRWLAETVAPTVGWLRCYGAEAQVIQALGLDKPPPTARTMRHSQLFAGHRSDDVGGGAE